MAKMIFIIIFFVFLLPGALTAQQVFKNLLSDEYFGFEGGGDGWWIQHPDNCGIVMDKAASGNYSIKFSSATNVTSSLKAHGGDEDFDDSTLNLNPGTYTMKLKVWVDSTATINELQTTIKTPWKNITWSFEGIEKGKWVELSKEIVLSEAVVDSKIMLAVNNGKGVFFIDDIEIWGHVEEEKPLIPYLANIESTGAENINLEAGSYKVKLKIRKEPSTHISSFSTIISDPWTNINWNIAEIEEGNWIELTNSLELKFAAQNTSLIIQVNNNPEFGGGSGTFYIDEIIFEKVAVSVETKLDNEFEFKVYPNPASDFLTIQSPSRSRLMVYSVSGIKVKDLYLSNVKTNVAVADLIPGIYLFKIGKESKVKTTKICIR